MIPENYKPDYQPWCEDEFSGDEIVQAMTVLQRYMYRTLLQKMFSCSTRPYLPADDKMLCMLSGCGDMNTWMQNKAEVMQKFSLVETESGQKYDHKRVHQDWDRLLNKRNELIERGRAGGLKARTVEAQLKRGLSGTQAELNRELKQERKKESIERKKESLSKPINLPKSISAVALGVLAHQFELTDKEKKGLEAIGKSFGDREVLEDFEIWANEVKTTGIKYPVSTYIGLAHSRLGVSDSVTDEAYAKFSSAIFEISQNAPAFQGITAAKQMLARYTAEDVIAAFREFFESRTDDYNRSRSVHDFFSGGVGFPAVETYIKRNVERLRIQILLDKSTESLQRVSKSKLEENDNFYETENP